MYVNFQYSTASYVSYLSSTKTLIWAMVKPRVPWSVPVKTLTSTGVETFTGSILAFESPSPFTMVETCGEPVGGFCSSYGDSSPDSDITCKINRCKKS